MEGTAFIAEGRVSTKQNSVRMEDSSWWADVEVAGVDAEITSNTGDVESPIVSVKWVYPGDGNGAILYYGPPRPGQSALIFQTANGTFYGQAGPSAEDIPLPAAVLANPSSLHIIAPAGASVNIASRGGAASSPAARKNDEVKSTSTEDATAWAWIAKVHAVCLALAASAGVTGFPADPPTSLTGKITKGSSRVVIGGTSE